jgi:cell wall assembly regulator SMI1
MPVVLSDALLEELMRRWRSQGAPIVEHLRPGLTESELDAATEPLGVRLCDELRTWWGWHDGVSAELGSHVPERELGPAGMLEYLPLAEAIAIYRERRRAAELGAERMLARDPASPYADPDTSWPRARFPLSKQAHGDLIACDCSRSHDAAGPLYVFVRDEGGFGGEPSAPSLGQTVCWWIEAIDLGALRYLPEERRWARHAVLIPPAARASMLV